MSKTAIVKHERSISALTETYGDPAKYHLLVPQMGMSDVPRGMRLVASRIDIDPNPTGGDVYPIPGQRDKLGIGKAKLNAIANAMGVDWIESKRVGDCSHPHYVEWRVVGRFVLPDGTVVTRPGHKVIDMRTDVGDGSPGSELAELVAVAAKRGRDAEDQARKVRQNIQSLAETKAMNRAIRSAAGLQTSYTREQLCKPFIAVKLAADPASEIGGKAALAALYGGTVAMFGPPSQPQVVDAEIADIEVADDAGSSPSPPSSAGVADVGHSADVSSPPHDVVDPETGEVAVGSAAVVRRVTDLWRDSERNGMSKEAFVALAKEATGKSASADMTIADTDVLAAAIAAWFDRRDSDPLG